MYCHRCGSEIPEGASFCIKCGTNIVSQSESEKVNGKTRNKGVHRPLYAVLMIFTVAVIMILTLSLILFARMSDSKEPDGDMAAIPDASETETETREYGDRDKDAAEPSDTEAAAEIAVDTEEIFPGNVEKGDTWEKPEFQELAEYSDVREVDRIVEQIEKICGLVDAGGFDGIGPNNYYRVEGDNGSFQDRLIKTGIGKGVNDELDALMERYGYSVYNLLFYYDNESSGIDAISDGPIKIIAEIDGKRYIYYFSQNHLIRRVTQGGMTDNIATNEFLRELYRVGFVIRWNFNEQNISPYDMGAETEASFYEEAKSIVVSAPDGYVNFRTGPGTEYDIITPISNGVVLPVYEIVNTGKSQWVKTFFQGRTGWVALSQATLLEYE